jgi:hypothetical protein
MQPITTLTINGFTLNQSRGKHTDLAFISLKIALKAYFSTYQTFRGSLHIVDSANAHNQAEIDFNHTTAYCAACAECIVHFQHFAELACKEFLRNDHPLLADVALNKPEILYKLLHSESLTAEEESSIQSIEFSQALERLTKLIKDKKLKDWSLLNFIVEHNKTISALNTLRNRMWHRGIFILRYPALDEFFGGYVLPLVSEVLKHPTYAGNERLWRYMNLSCGIDPISEIISTTKTANYDMGKIALLKELGRAAFESPINTPMPADPAGLSNILSSFNNQHKERAKRIAALEAQQDYSTVKACPVCGVNSLIIYEQTGSVDHLDTGEPLEVWQYTDMVKCECCSFELWGGVKNAREYGFPAIEDYWP